MFRHEDAYEQDDADKATSRRPRPTGKTHAGKKTSLRKRAPSIPKGEQQYNDEIPDPESETVVPEWP